MNAANSGGPANIDTDLLIKIRMYLTHREDGLSPSQDLEAAWRIFYDTYDRKIRAYAFTCGAADEEIDDCVQEVWRELLGRLPTFQFDPSRGQFNTWLYSIVQGKTIDLHRSRKRRLMLGNSTILETVADNRASPGQVLEEKEMATMAWVQLRESLSECNLEVLRLRLVEQRPVSEVAEKLGLSHEQVWYRYHRAHRELVKIGSDLAQGNRSPPPHDDPSQEKNGKNDKFAQGKAAASVSRIVSLGSLAREGGNCVDYVFQKVELGRRELTPEWKVEWNCEAEPKAVLYIRKMAIVAYAEMCGREELMNAQWPRIVNAAITAGVAAGIATIIATPTAALPIFRTEFYKHLQGKGGSAVDEKIQVALSAKQEANGPWYVCKE